MAAQDEQIGGDHYRKLTVQPWQAMQAWMSPEQFSGFLQGNIIKYIVRYRDKGGVTDLEKARHYLDKLMEIERASGQPSPAPNPPAEPLHHESDATGFIDVPGVRMGVGMGAECQIPPAGWACTRPGGHDGPCAAYPTTSLFPPSAFRADG